MNPLSPEAVEINLHQQALERAMHLLFEIEKQLHCGPGWATVFHARSYLREQWYANRERLHAPEQESEIQ